MGIQEEMIRENVETWLNNLCIGAKAWTQKVVCGVCAEDEAWKYTTHTYKVGEISEYTNLPYVYIHELPLVAECMGFEVNFRVIDSYILDYESEKYAGEKFFIYNEVEFADLVWVKDLSPEERKIYENRKAVLKAKENENAEREENAGE